MSDTYTCWKCGAAQPELLLPLARLAECPSCRAQLHVCRMCTYFDPAAAQQCREPIADAVADKQRANFCGYFQIRPNAFVAPTDQAAASRSRLDALFGEAAPASAPGESRSPEDVAREKLEQMFKK
jgi:ribosomal protein L40E